MRSGAGSCRLRSPSGSSRSGRSDGCWRRRGDLRRRRVPMFSKGAERTLVGVEAVIKDLASELLAREVDGLFVMATDVDGVYAGWGTPDRRRLDEVTVDELRAGEFAAGSMGPKVGAAISSSSGPGSGPRSAAWRISRRSWRGPAAPRWCPGDLRTGNGGDDMTEFGVHSEVGKLHKVMVHRPELSLQRLTPTTTSCCSTTCCGSNGRSTSTTSSSRRCAGEAWRSSCSGPAGRGTGRERGSPEATDRGRGHRVHGGVSWWTRSGAPSGT